MGRKATVIDPAIHGVLGDPEVLGDFFDGCPGLSQWRVLPHVRARPWRRSLSKANSLDKNRLKSKIIGADFRREVWMVEWKSRRIGHRLCAPDDTSASPPCPGCSSRTSSRPPRCGRGSLGSPRLLRRRPEQHPFQPLDGGLLGGGRTNSFQIQGEGLFRMR